MPIKAKDVQERGGTIMIVMGKQLIEPQILLSYCRTYELLLI